MREASSVDVTKITGDVTKLRNTIIQGDTLEVLKQLPDAFVQCCVTSPPYYALRDYGVDGQIGREETPKRYIERLVAVFREVRRVLRADGVLWLNIGDTYANDVEQGGHSSGKHQKELHQMVRLRRFTGLPGKNLLGIPWRLALALQADGWYLRCDIIWSKVNALPESVKDRPTRAHEYLFLLSKSARYFYDADAIREPLITESNKRWKSREPWGKLAQLTPVGEGIREWNHPMGRNKRSVWTINTQPFPQAHFAVMPPKLVEPCILAGSRIGNVVLDPFMGSGTVAMVAKQQGRSYLGIELNPDYVRLAEERLAGIPFSIWQEMSWQEI
jgi:DNA modification methylase